MTREQFDTLTQHAASLIVDDPLIEAAADDYAGRNAAGTARDEAWHAARSTFLQTLMAAATASLVIVTE